MGTQRKILRNKNKKDFEKFKKQLVEYREVNELDVRMPSFKEFLNYKKKVNKKKGDVADDSDVDTDWEEESG